MLSSCILSIGKEIISGFINDTNSSYIALLLTEFGIYNRFIVSTDDTENDIKESFLSCIDKVDIIITTGGLGPTYDDITIPSIAKALNKKIILSKSAYNHIKAFYRELYKKGKIDSPDMNEKRTKMAYIPEGAVELENSTGAAKGIYIKENNKHIFCLPGIPKEMKPMFENGVIPILKNLSDGFIVHKTYELNINDETILGKFIDKIQSDSIHIKSLPTGFDSKTIGVRFTAFGESKEECLDKIESAKNKLIEELKPYNA